MPAEAREMSRECERCSRPFALPVSGAGRTRRMCETCSPPVRKVAPSTLPPTNNEWLKSVPIKDAGQEPFSSDMEGHEPPTRIPSDLEKTVEKELTALEVIDSTDAMLALRLCRALDDPDLTGTQIASLVKTLQAHMKMIRDAAPLIDEDEEAAQAALVLKLSRRL